MSFANPALLLGLLGIVVPIAIHLINRQRAVRVRFPAIAFLLRSNQRLARRLKIKQLALLLLRIGIFALLPLAMARPSARCGGADTAGDARLPTAVVVIVDDSASMSQRAGGATAYERAVERAIERVDALRSWDQVAVVIAARSPIALVAGPSTDRVEAVRRLRAHRPSFGSVDAGAALDEAARLLGTSTLPARRTVYLTDGHAAGWDGASAPPGLGTLEIVDVVGATQRENAAVVGVTVAPAPSGIPGSYTVNAGLRAWGAAAGRTVAVDLLAGGAVVGTTEVTLVEGATVSFERDFSDEVEVAVALAEPIGATVDDRAGAWVAPERAVRAVIVNGDPRAVAFNDEAYYLTRALDVPADGRRDFEVTSITPELLDGRALERAEVVIAANVAGLPPAAVEALRAFVQGGGGLLLAGGDRVVAATWNAGLADLLPRPLRGTRVLARATDPDAAIRATRIGAFDPSHPAFRVFTLPRGASLQSANVYAYLLVEPTGDAPVRTALRLADGAPALLERAVGAGRVQLWTTSIDFDWTDLPIRPAYVPLVRRLVSYLARRGLDQEVRVALGDTARLDVDASAAWVVSPAGARSAARLQDGQAVVSPSELGRHVLEAVQPDGSRVELGAVWATPPAAELDPRRWDDETIGALRDAAIERGGGATTAGAAGRSLWPGLLFATLVLLYAESLVSIRRRVWARLRRV